MAMTNAISGMTIVGGMLQMGGGIMPHTTPQILAATAVTLSAVGYLTNLYIHSLDQLTLSTHPIHALYQHSRYHISIQLITHPIYPPLPLSTPPINTPYQPPLLPLSTPFPYPQVNLAGGTIVTKKMLDMFKRPDDAPEYNEYYMLPGAAAIVGSGALFATGTCLHTIYCPSYHHLSICPSYLHTLSAHRINTRFPHFSSLHPFDTLY